METQKTLSSQNNLEKEEQAGGIKTLDFKLCYKAKSSKHYSAGTNTDT